MLFEIILIVFLSSTECSVVVDSLSQKGIYISDYCPKMEYCAEGSHVMCMYYNPKHPKGPLCRNAQNVSITPELANKLLDVSNAMRSKIARGEEKGKNGVRFPRGYGIFRLKWDTELATFAQVLANQCSLNHDLCRATKKFPDPGQTISVVIFTIPNWTTTFSNFSSKGLTTEKLMYAVTTSLKTWYMQKNLVTAQTLATCPDWEAFPERRKERLYLDMIYGPATHMGCGISAYADYAYQNNSSPLNRNVVQVVCNFSGRARRGTAVFNTVPPSDSATDFNRCGCPAGSVEDDDCLCHEVPSKQPEPSFDIVQRSQSCPNGDCDPTVVVLPIFTVEDAPPDRLIPTNRYSNSSGKGAGRMAPSELNSFEELTIYNNSKINQNPNTQTQLHQKYSGQKPRPATRKLVSVRNRHFDRKFDEHKSFDDHDNRQFRKHNQNSHRPSIFSKTPRFELPGPLFIETTKRDVVPRKYFSTGEKARNMLAQKNLMLPTNNNKPHAVKPQSIETHHFNEHFHHNYVHFDEIFTTETVLNTAEQKVINHKYHMKDINNQNPNSNIVRQDTKAVTEEGDSKLMALLDTLEQEVKHIELRDKEKEIFDAKIMKIYGKVVGKSVNTLVSIKTTVKPTETRTEMNERLTDHKDLKSSKERNVVTLTDNNDNQLDDDDSVHKLEPPHDKSKQIKSINEKQLRDSPDLDFDNFDKYPKHEIDDMDVGDLSRIMSKTYKKHFKYDKRDKSHVQHKNIVRQRNHNELDSPEFKERFEEYSGRKIHKTNNLDNKSTDNDKPIYRSEALSKRYRNKNYANNAWAQDLLSSERRKFYQEKLDEMERKLQNVRRYSRRKSPSSRPHMRAMRPSGRTDNQMDTMYNPGRSRFLNGY